MSFSNNKHGLPGICLGACLAVFALTLAACQSANTSNIQGFGKGERCVNDSKKCIAERSTALNTLLLDKKNTWIKQPPTAQSYASGVRLFAYKTKKKALSCKELALATKEANGAPRVLRGTAGSGLKPAQISRGLMFAEDVAREMKRESRRRCKRRRKKT